MGQQDYEFGTINRVQPPPVCEVEFSADSDVADKTFPTTPEEKAEKAKELINGNAIPPQPQSTLPDRKAGRPHPIGGQPALLRADTIPIGSAKRLSSTRLYLECSAHNGEDSKLAALEHSRYNPFRSAAATRM